LPAWLSTWAQCIGTLDDDESSGDGLPSLSDARQRALNTRASVVVGPFAVVDAVVGGLLPL
jgi:hypothetical protein